MLLTVHILSHAQLYCNINCVLSQILVYHLTLLLLGINLFRLFYSLFCQAIFLRHQVKATGTARYGCFTPTTPTTPEHPPTTH